MRVKAPDKIRQGRKLKGWTQRQVAALCGRSQNAVHLLECGQRDTIGEDFAMALFRHLELGRTLGLRVEDVFDDPSAAFVAAASSDSGITAQSGSE